MGKAKKTETEAETKPESVTEEKPQSEGADDLSSGAIQKLVEAIKPVYGDGKLPGALFLNEDDKIYVTIYLYLEPLDKKLVRISLTPDIIMRSTGMLEYEIRSEWTIPGRMKIQDYRDEVSVFDKLSRMTVVPRERLLNVLLIRHLKGLEVKVDQTNWNSIELNTGTNGSLTQESLKTIEKLHPSLVEILIEKYITEAVLII